MYAEDSLANWDDFVVLKPSSSTETAASGTFITKHELETALFTLDVDAEILHQTRELPGPTGANNQLSHVCRGRYILLSNQPEQIQSQVDKMLNAGANVLVKSPPILKPCPQ